MRRSTRHPRRDAGFSLLEAIVALTIMATTLLALYSWLSSNTIALNRTREVAYSVQDARTALAVVETINPMEQPRGDRTLPPLDIRWVARPITELRTGMSRSGTPTQFDFMLYEMDVEVFRDGILSRDFTVRRAGWDAARPINPDDW